MLGIKGRKYTASRSDSVFDELNACRHYLDTAIEHEKAGDTKKFRYALGAFSNRFALSRTDCAVSGTIQRFRRS
jgi:hypothetical protein